jgi:hypothetical protein
MRFKPGKWCPLIKKECVGLKCAWFVEVRGMNPNTGEMVDEWNCSIAWLPMMQIETSQQARQAGAAVESFRNEVVRTNAENQQLYLNFMEQVKEGNILPANVTPLDNPINMLEPGSDNSEENNS